MKIIKSFSLRGPRQAGIVIEATREEYEQLANYIKFMYHPWEKCSAQYIIWCYNAILKKYPNHILDINDLELPIFYEAVETLGMELIDETKTNQSNDAS